MELKEMIAEALYQANYDEKLEWLQVNGFYNALAEAILPTIEEYGDEMFAQGVDEFLDANDTETAKAVKLEREKLIRQIETISYDGPCGHKCMCIFKDAWETLIKEEA